MAPHNTHRLLRTTLLASLLTAYCALLTPATAQCISGDCKNGKGTYQYPSGAKYVGEFKNGEINGVGVCYYTNGSKYSGEWRADRKSVV